MLNEWIEDYKNTNSISDGAISIELCLRIEDLKKRDFLGKRNIEYILPKAIFIDDERNFENEEYGGAGSITKKFFEEFDLNDSNENISEIAEIKEKRAQDLSLQELEALLRLKGGDITLQMQEKIESNFKEYYNNEYGIIISPTTSIGHKNFSLETKIEDPNIGEISLSNVGAGLRSLYLLSLLKAYNDSNKNSNIIFLVEEPELYLHPGLQKEMSTILTNIGTEQQVLFTTHSPIFLKNIDLNSILEVKKIKSCSFINKASFDDIITNLGFSLFDIIKYEYIIFVEGKDDCNILEKIIEKFYSNKKDKVKIISSCGCANLNFYASLKFLGLTNSGNIKYFILRDKDNKDDDELIEEFKESLVKKDIEGNFVSELCYKFRILDRYSIENFFLIQIYLRKLINILF